MATIGAFAGTRFAASPVTADDGTTAYQLQVVGGATAIPTSAPASATATPTQVASNVAAVTLLAANANRRGATIYYDGAAILYLLEGAGTPSATNYTIKMGASNFVQYEAPAGFTGAIKGIWSAAVGSANVTERTA